jgi:hypothetical protein
MGDTTQPESRDGVHGTMALSDGPVDRVVRQGRGPGEGVSAQGGRLGPRGIGRRFVLGVGLAFVVLVVAPLPASVARGDFGSDVPQTTWVPSEPGALNADAGICAGARQQWRPLPRPDASSLRDATTQIGRR